MPEILKHANGNTDYAKIFGAIAMALVLVLQQWQSYRIAEIKAQGEVNSINFMSKDDIEKRLEKIENKFMNREELRLHIDRIDNRIDTLEKQNENRQSRTSIN